jgi:putative transferase (TIGR04331 family)
LVTTTLVTTAMESTWPKEGPVLFLGSWCCSFSRRSYWSSLDAEMVSYHWDDRSKLRKDYDNLELIYEHFLDMFSKGLNSFHHTSFSNRFWRILIGPWLYTCIQIVFDRWSVLVAATESQSSISMNAIINDIGFLATYDMDQFNKAIETDEWNEALFSFLAAEIFRSKILINYVNKPMAEIQRTGGPRRKKLKAILMKFSNAVSGFFCRSTDVFFIGSHLPFLRQVKILATFRQIPAFWFRPAKKFSYTYSRKARNKLSLSCDLGVLPEFERVLENTLMNLIPACYLEGFSDLLQDSTCQGWPENPKAIFTSNSYSSDEVFKCWAGSRVDSGSKLVIGQHGGNFGMTPMAIHESHQIKIADRWLSWGWEKHSEPKIVPVGNFKLKFNALKHDPAGNALIVSMTLPRYSYYLYSVPIAGQLNRYFDDQLCFMDSLDESIKKKILVRMYPEDRGWNQKMRWQHYRSDIRFDNSNQTLLKSLSKSRIFVGTYNATTYLETFSVNMPTILFWDPYFWEINAESHFYFERLKEVKVFHETPQCAAKHLVKIWDDVDAWWFSSEVQAAVKDFLDTFSKENMAINKTIVDVIANS